MIQIVRKDEQASGMFDGGKIQEHKPIGFFNEGGAGQAFSCLFYWSHAWSDEGGEIGEHPHQGFEIVSYVKDGSIEHYDSKGKKWIPLGKGGVQVIKSGNGIYHAERINAGASMFQIWFDPGLETTLSHPASYNDYKESEAIKIDENGNRIRRYLGDSAPVNLVAPVIRIDKIDYNGQLDLTTNDSKIACFLMSGDLANEKASLEPGDLLVTDESELSFKGSGEAFLIEVPSKLNYKTYLELMP